MEGPQVNEKVEQEKWMSKGAACALFMKVEVDGGCAAAVLLEWSSLKC